MSNNYYRPSGLGGFSFFPPVLKKIIIINVAVFIVQFLFLNNLIVGGVPLQYYIDRWFALNPLSGLDQLGNSYNFQVWQLITYQFMHGGFWHIALNMFILWMFAVEIENIWGSRKFLFFYLMCGVVAGISQLIISPLFGVEAAPTIGASGAIYGVLIAFAMLFPDRYIFLYFFIPVKAKYLITFFILLQIFSVENVMDNVAHLAHLGGALAGFIYVLYDRQSSIQIKNPFKNIFNKSGRGNLFGSRSNPFTKKQENIQDAKYYEIKDDDDQSSSEDINQEEIDAILDKISKSGYQNLSEREKRILFEASKKMK